MVVGKGPPPTKFHDDVKNLEGWILKMADYFTVTLTCNKQQRLVYVSLCTQGKALEWWTANKHRYTTWKQVKDAIREYYSDHCKPDEAFNEISDLK